MKEFKVGDLVYMDGYTSMAQSALAYDKGSKVKEVRYKFDEDTGEKYQQIKVNRSWYDARNGACVSNKNSMYFIIV